MGGGFPIVENRMDKIMENEMETEVLPWLVGFRKSGRVPYHGMYQHRYFAKSHYALLLGTGPNDYFVRSRERGNGSIST